MEINLVIKDEADYAMYGYALGDTYWLLWNAVKIGFTKRSFVERSGRVRMPRIFRGYFQYYKWKDEDDYRIDF